MERVFKKMSNQHFHFAILLYTDSHPIIQTFYHSRHTLAAGRIFGCEVQSPAVDAENFWDESRITMVVPMAGIFLSLAAKRIPAKSLRHRRTAYPAPKNNFLGQGQTARKQGNKNI